MKTLRDIIDKLLYECEGVSSKECGTYGEPVKKCLSQLEEYYKPKLEAVYRRGKYDAEHANSLELLPKIDGQYQCEHIKEKVIRSNCIWCNLTVAEKIIDRLKREITELKAK